MPPDGAGSGPRLFLFLNYAQVSIITFRYFIEYYGKLFIYATLRHNFTVQHNLRQVAGIIVMSFHAAKNQAIISHCGSYPKIQNIPYVFQ